MYSIIKGGLYTKILKIHFGTDIEQCVYTVQNQLCNSSICRKIEIEMDFIEEAFKLENQHMAEI